MSERLAWPDSIDTEDRADGAAVGEREESVAHGDAHVTWTSWASVKGHATSQRVARPHKLPTTTTRLQPLPETATISLETGRFSGEPEDQTSAKMAAASAASTSQSKSGYDFGSFGRNSHLSHKGYPVPKATSTGTTLAGVIFDGGVVVGADTRASAGPLVADKDCEKVSTSKG